MMFSWLNCDSMEARRSDSFHEPDAAVRDASPVGGFDPRRSADKRAGFLQIGHLENEDYFIRIIDVPPQAFEHCGFLDSVREYTPDRPFHYGASRGHPRGASSAPTPGT